jgi:hypothetical protein
VVAGGDLLDVRSDSLDDAGAFVAEHDRQRHRVHLIAHDEVGVAQPGGDDADEYLVVAWLVEVCRRQLEGPLRADDSGLATVIFPATVSASCDAMSVTAPYGTASATTSARPPADARSVVVPTPSSVPTASSLSTSPSATLTSWPVCLAARAIPEPTLPEPITEIRTVATYPRDAGRLHAGPAEFDPCQRVARRRDPATLRRFTHRSSCEALRTVA